MIKGSGEDARARTKFYRKRLCGTVAAYSSDHPLRERQSPGRSSLAGGTSVLLAPGRAPRSPLRHPPQTRGAGQSWPRYRVRAAGPAARGGWRLAEAPCPAAAAGASPPARSGPGGTGRRPRSSRCSAPAALGEKPASPPSLRGPGAAIARPGCLKRVTFDPSRCSENGHTQG